MAACRHLLPLRLTYLGKASICATAKCSKSITPLVDHLNNYNWTTHCYHYIDITTSAQVSLGHQQPEAVIHRSQHEDGWPWFVQQAWETKQMWAMQTSNVGFIWRGSLKECVWLFSVPIDYTNGYWRQASTRLVIRDGGSTAICVGLHCKY